MSELYTEESPSYYLNLRQFSSGEFEAVMKVVKPMSEELIKHSIAGTSYAAACAEKGETSRSGFTSFRVRPVEEKTDFDHQSNHNRAVRRAKQNIRWLAKAMCADRLFTLSYRDNVTDREKVREDFKRFIRYVRHGWRGQEGIQGWQYVAVLELQERGAFHIHCAVKGWQRVKYLRQCWYKALGGRGDETGSETPGAVNVTNPDRKRWGHTGRQWKVNKLSGYLTKYLAKTFDTSSSEKKRYWHARDITLPEKQRYWIGGASMPEAIKEAYSMLQFLTGVTVDCNMWVSSLNDVFWIAGRPPANSPDFRISA